eukprot:tig00000455_g1018.t1
MKLKTAPAAPVEGKAAAYQSISGRKDDGTDDSELLAARSCTPSPRRSKPVTADLHLDVGGSSGSDSGEKRPPLVRRLADGVRDAVRSVGDWLFGSLRSKTVLSIGLLTLLLVAIVSGLTLSIFPQSFERIEADGMADNVRRFAIAMQGDLRVLRDKLALYAQWDETIEMIGRAEVDPGDPAVVHYMDDNFNGPLLDSVSADFVFFYNLNGALVASAVREGLAPPPAFARLASENPLSALGHPNEWVKVGYTVLDAPAELPGTGGGAAAAADGVLSRLLVVASMNVVASDGTGPSAGTAVFARRFSAGELGTLAERTSLCATAALLPLPTAPAPAPAPDVARAAAALPPPLSLDLAMGGDAWAEKPGEKRTRLEALERSYLAPGGAGYDPVRRCAPHADDASSSYDRIAAYFGVESVAGAGAPALLLRLDRPRDVVEVCWG